MASCENVSVIFCGQAREPELMLAGVRNIRGLRGRNYRIDRIVFATWKGEIQRHEGLSQHLASFGVDIVEVDDPAHIPLGNGNIERQMIALHWGLNITEPRTHVFRTRTDMGLNTVPELGLLFEDYIDQVQQAPHRFDDFRLWVGSFSARTLFFAQDRFFMGPYEALRELANFRNDIGILSDPGMNIPEVRWFGGAMSRRYPQITAMLSFNWLQAELTRHDLFDAIATTEFARATFRNYFKIIDRHFLVGSSRITLETLARDNVRPVLAEIPFPSEAFLNHRAQILAKLNMELEAIDFDHPMEDITLEMLEEADRVLRPLGGMIGAGVPRIIRAQA